MRTDSGDHPGGILSPRRPVCPQRPCLRWPRTGPGNARSGSAIPTPIVELAGLQPRGCPFGPRRLQSMVIESDRITSHPLFHFDDILGARPLGGGNDLRKCKGELVFRTLAMSFRHGTNWPERHYFQKTLVSPHSHFPSPETRPARLRRVAKSKSGDQTTQVRCGGSAGRTYDPGAVAREGPLEFFSSVTSA